MKYNSIVFREFTHQSIERITCYRQEEAERIATEQLEQQAMSDNDDNEQQHIHKSSRAGPTTSKRLRPDKELAVGEKLPQVLQRKFPIELIGKPIEEIDHYYRTEYVCWIYRKMSYCFFFKR